jgi:hypothetical protein
MAHFAKLDDNNKVLEVHALANYVIADENGDEQEQLGIDFLTKIHKYPLWKQTSYNSKFRKNYAGTGSTYDEEKDAFITPQSYPSWKLNEDTCQWEPPIPYPSKDDPKIIYWWNEKLTSWGRIKKNT